MTKLLIISNMSHYRNKQGQLVGWGPTVEEINYLGTIFSEVNHIGCLHDEDAPPSALPYQTQNIRFIPVPPRGGPSLKDKMAILGQFPRYIKAMWQEIPQADVIHVRCPANISLLAILLLSLKRWPSCRWVKYAGNWQPERPEALSYRWQRWWLRRGWQGGVVTVNGRWPQQPSHIHAFYNPCLTQAEQEIARQKALSKRLQLPLCLLFVGALNRAKGVPQVLQIAGELQKKKIPFTLHLLGDGPERPIFEEESRRIGLETAIIFHGWLPKNALADFYVQAHFLLLPSRTEGWPKVLSEAMAYGVVPLASHVSTIPPILAEIGAGRSYPAQDVAAFTDSICDYLQSPQQWKRESLAGIQAAPRFTYEAYVAAVRTLLATMASE